MGTNFITRKNKMKLKQSFMLLMSFLVLFSGMIPSISAATANEVELPYFEKPEVLKDVEGADHKELITEEDFTYNIHVVLPKDLTGYEHVEISDNLDKNLIIQETSILINGDVTDTLVATEEGQSVFLKLTMEQLEELAGNELVLQITAQVKEDATVGETIENIAQVLINDIVEIETNSVLVTPINSETTENENKDINDSDMEEAKEERKESKSEDINTHVDEKTKEDEEVLEEVVPKKEVATAQQQDAEGITMNDIDFYRYANGWIVQYEGDPEKIRENGGETWEKGRVKSDLDSGNALAKGKDAFYASIPSNGKLFKIEGNGATSEIGNLRNGTPAAGMSKDGSKYIYIYSWEGVPWISSYDVNTNTSEDKLITNVTGNEDFAHRVNGDLVVDVDGYVWQTTYTPDTSHLVRIDPTTGELDRIIPIRYPDGSPINTIGELAFLSDGTLVGKGGSEVPYDIVLIDPTSGLIKSIIGEINGPSSDFASSVFPDLKPILSIEKSVTPTETVSHGEELTYTLEIQNSGNLASTLTTVADELPDGTTYVPNSTTLNGEDVEDENGESPLFTGMLVNSPNETLEGVLYVGEDNVATVTFKVTVNESVPSGKEILNVAHVSYDGEEDITSNEVVNIVNYKDPKIESDKSVEIEEKSDGNADEANPEVGDILRYTITTQNIVEDSIVENLIISDEIPEGLTYVEDSLEVDGVSVTDDEDNDAGHVINGLVTGTFGDIIDTDKHTVTFLVTVDAGQAGKDINNVALVESTNTPPDEPEEGIKVYPRDPLLDAEKYAKNVEEGKETNEVGDTLVYTIRAQNTVSDSLVENFTITDELPEGLTFVEGSLVTSHEGEATYENGVITATFGDVSDTEWRSVIFEVTIDEGQSGEKIINTAIAEGDNVPPATPEEKITVDPKDPLLEAEKTASLEEKASGNTDADNVEVGDTVRYTITTQNTVSDSLVENLTITDKLPAGVTYVSDSLEASHEGEATYENGVITATFGDVTDTDERSVTFLVTVDAGQAGKDINNVALVESTNTPPDEPEEGIKVYPRDPLLDAEKYAKNVEEGKETNEVGDTLVYTIRAQNTVSDSLVENFTITDELPEGLTFVEGSLVTSHEGEAIYENGVITATFGDVSDTEWRSVIFEVTIDEGQSGEKIINTAIAEGDNVPPATPEEKITVDPKDPLLEAEKTASLEEKASGNTDADNVEVGDTVRYTITTQNTVSDSLVENLTITDKLPAGVTYVSDSLEASHEGEATYENGVITATFGDVTDTDERSVTFLVTVNKGQAGNDIENTAKADGDNITEPLEPKEEITIYPRDPLLDAEKYAKNVEEGKETNEVGDTLVYTIRAQNTVSDSLVENFTITDELPEGLTFVEGSLVASHEGEATYENGVITATFGDVSDTEWRSVIFEVTIDEGQSGEEIINTAIAEGNDVPPTTPEEKITVDPKDPLLEAEKSASLEEKASGNMDVDNVEVGDTVRYTITTQNTVSDSLVENLIITDELPEGLTFVEGSLVASHEGEATYENGVITATFGDVTDTDERSVTFLVTVNEDQSGETITNTAIAEGDNTPRIITEETIFVEEMDREIPVEPESPENQNQPKKPVDGNELPNTATNLYNLLLFGTLFLLFGIVVRQYLNKRRRN